MPEHDGDLAIALDDQGRVACDLPCAGCGYNLRTLASSGACPECGTAVKRAIFVARLRFADPKWLRSMSYSVFWLTIGVGVLLLSLTEEFFRHPPLFLHALFVAAPVVTLMVGVWQATRREPGRRPWVGDALRQIARGSIAVGFLLFLICIFSWPSLAATRSAWVVDVIAAAATFCVVTGVLFGLLVGASVAIRIRNRWLTTAIVVFFLTGVLLLGAVFLMVFYEPVADIIWNFENWLLRLGLAVPMSSWFWELRYWTDQLVFYGWGRLLLSGLGLIALPMLWWYRRRLRDAARIAQQHQDTLSKTI